MAGVKVPYAKTKEAVERRRDRVAMLVAGRLAAGAYIDVAELVTVEAEIRKQVTSG